MIDKRHTDTIIEIAGWIGVVLVLGSYFLLASGFIHSESWEYHVMILVGAVFVAIVSYRKRSFQPALLNIVFVVLAVIALLRLSLQ